MVTVELDLPPTLGIKIPIGFMDRKVNINDEISMEYLYDVENPDTVMYSASLYYELE